MGSSADTEGHPARIDIDQVESEDGSTTLLHFRHVAPEQAERQLPGGA